MSNPGSVQQKVFPGFILGLLNLDRSQEHGGEMSLEKCSVSNPKLIHTVPG